MFDAYLIDLIASFMETDEYAMVSYQLLQKAGSDKYVTKSIFAAYITDGALKDPKIRFRHGLPVDVSKIPLVLLREVYQPYADDVYITMGIYHPQLIDKIITLGPEFYPNGIPFDLSICKRLYGTDMFRHYLTSLTNPIRAIVFLVDVDDVEWVKKMVNIYGIIDEVVTPRSFKMWSVLSAAKCLISYEALPREVLPIIAGSSIEAQQGILERNDADTLPIVFKKDIRVILSAIRNSHLSVVKKTLVKRNKYVKEIYQNLMNATDEVCKYVYEFIGYIEGCDMIHPYIYKTLHGDSCPDEYLVKKCERIIGVNSKIESLRRLPKNDARL